MERELKRYYTDIKINVSMGKLRTIRVFVVGKAVRPGSFTLSSLSTLINALFAAGGPAKVGTMRDIQLKRNDKTIVHFDLYDFILKGDKSKDMRILPEDVIFIPIVGPLVGVAGNVKVPAIYELKGKTTLKDILEMAGGINATGYLQKVQLERVFENQAKVIIDLNLKELPESENIPLKDGDLVRVFSILQMATNPIELKGNVTRPGIYEWREGIKLRDIIQSTEDLLPDTLLDFALIERLVPPDYHKEYLSFNLGKILLGGDEGENISLNPYDYIHIYNKWDFMEKEEVRITGAVNKPGEFEFRPKMRLSNLIRLAGGLKKYAYTKHAELTRVTPTPDGPHTEKIIIDLEKAIEGDLQHDIPLKENDYLLVKSVPEWQLYRTATIMGEVRFPGTYPLKKGESLSSLIEMAGGYTDKAYLKGAIFTRVSVREAQQRQLDDMIQRFELQLLSQSAETIEAALTPEEAKQLKAATELRRAFIAKLKAAKVKGRISIRLDTLERFKGSSSDISLEEGDILIIPEISQHIQVIGAVYNPVAFLYDPKSTLESYIEKAGGFTRHADEKGIYILKADGTALSKSALRGWSWGIGWNKEEYRWEVAEKHQSDLEPGDTIVVPQRIKKIAWLKEIKDVTQILFQIAVTAGVLIVAF